ncbi:glycosyltransferase, partial [Microbacterium aurum]
MGTAALTRTGPPSCERSCSAGRTTFRCRHHRWPRRSSPRSPRHRTRGVGLGGPARVGQRRRRRDLYPTATALAIPSLAEGFSLPALEAMSAGVPVLLSDIDVHRYVGASSLPT